jgi:hypothetical protein
LPTEIQFLVDAGQKISTNFALREVSPAAYGEQQTHLRSILSPSTMAIGQWISTATKID